MGVFHLLMENKNKEPGKFMMSFFKKILFLKIGRINVNFSEVPRQDYFKINLVYCFKWFQMVSNGFKWFQMVSNGFKWFQKKYCVIFMAKKNLQTEGHNISILLIVVLISSSTALLWTSWQTFNAFNDSKNAIKQQIYAEKLRGRIIHLDEVLTMSARMAAATGDLRWEQRYHQFEPTLDKAIKDAFMLVPEGYQDSSAKITDNANKALVEMELRSFSLIRKGQKEEAKNLLFGDDYEMHKKIYTEGMTKFIKSISFSVDKKLTEQNQRLSLFAIPILILLVLLLFSWVIIYRSINKWKKVMVLTNQSLETKVKERTIELQQKELSLISSLNSMKQSEERFHTIFSEAPLGVAVIDSLTAHIYDANPAYAKIAGRSIEELRLLDWTQITHPDDIQQDLDNMARMNAGETDGFVMQKRYVQPDGTVRWINMTIASMQVEDKNKPRHLCMTEDITEKKQVEEKQRLAAKVFENTNEGILITNKNSIIVDINPAFVEITGYKREEIIGQKPNILNSGKHRASFYKNMWDSLNASGHWQGEIWNRKKNGAFYAELLSISSLTDEYGNVLHYVGIFTDITSSKNQQELLEKLAHYDALTQLPNRILLHDRFIQAIAHCKRQENLLAVCFLDLDHFKPVNDQYGHETGDQLLIDVAQRIKSIIREEDTLSRQGGDEFVLLLGDIESFAHCEKMIKRIIHSLSQPYIIDREVINVSASIGVTLYPIDDSDGDTLIRHADQAMYQAKTAGRNRYQLFNTEKNQLETQKFIHLEEIQHALENNQLCMYYQPKIDMASGKVFGAEALIRWNHPENGLIPPLKFLPVIEETQLEIEIGNWVINQALKQLQEWQQLGIKLEISINISSYHLQQASFTTELDAALALYPEVSSKKLQLEILESSALGDLNTITGIIKTCIDALGVNIALDDFGTGYSSLTHLRNLPVQTIKIDQSFVRDILDDPSDYTIVDGVIGLTESFDREIIAEGVETTAHGLILLTMGCQNAQGYGIAKPMPSQELPDWLNNYTPNEDWVMFANKPHTEKENAIKLFRLTLAHWQKLFEKDINASPGSAQHWPILKRTKCHCGIGIKRARQEKLFEEKWITKLEISHNVMHDLADELFKKYQEGQIETARENLNTFQTATEDLLNILGQCE